MRRILICDDDSSFLHQLEQKLCLIFAERGIAVRIDLTQNAVAVMERLAQDPVDALFLDVEMPGLSGLEIAPHIVKLYPRTILFFVSSQERYVFEAIKCQPLRFIRKSCIDTEIEEAVSAYINAVRSRDVKIHFEINKLVKTFRVQEILYVYSEGNYVVFRTDNGPEKFRYTLKQVEKKLCIHHFVRCSNDYIVNCRRARGLNSDGIEMEDDVIIPISRARLSTVRSTFAVMLREFA